MKNMRETDSDRSSDDDSYQMVNKPDYSSSESFEIVGSDESSNRMTDFEETLFDTPELSELENKVIDCEENLRKMHIKDEYEINNDTDDSAGVYEEDDLDMLIDDILCFPIVQEYEINNDTDDSAGVYEEDDSDMLCFPIAQDNPVHFQTRLLEYPESIRRRGEMELKDVVAENALHFLPAKSVCRFRAVSKDWCRKISCPVFPYQQSTSFRSISGYFNKNPDSYYPAFISLNKSTYGIPSPSLSFLPEQVNIRSSTNGLLLCQSNSGRYYVCNPVTEKYQLLPYSQYYHGEPSRAVIAFEPTDDRCFETAYFVICPFTFPGVNDTYFEIYSSATMTWRSWDSDSVILLESELKDNGFYFNGMLYWEARDGSVLVFDMRFELCSVESLPVSREPGGSLSILEQDLCYITGYFSDTWTFEINVRKAFDMSLKRVFTVVVPNALRSYRGFCRVLPCINDDVLCCITTYGIFAVSLKDESVEVVTKDGIRTSDEFVPYVNSLVPLEERK